MWARRAGLLLFITLVGVDDVHLALAVGGEVGVGHSDGEPHSVVEQRRPRERGGVVVLLRGEAHHGGDVVCQPPPRAPTVSRRKPLQSASGSLFSQPAEASSVSRCAGDLTSANRNEARTCARAPGLSDPATDRGGRRASNVLPCSPGSTPLTPHPGSHLVRGYPAPEASGRPASTRT
eukprot:42519-Prorocentrum_minimum.AAC.1